MEEGQVRHSEEEIERAIEESLLHAKEVAAQHEQLKRNMTTWGYQEIEVPGDNNCQFHAIVDQLTRYGVRTYPDALSLRMHVCDWLRGAGDLLMDQSGLGERTTLKDAVGVLDWEAYVDEMCRHDEIWGDEATLLAIATLFEAEVIVISSLCGGCAPRTITPPVHWNVKTRRRFVLGHYHEYHYTSARQCDTS